MHKTFCLIEFFLIQKKSHHTCFTGESTVYVFNTTPPLLHMTVWPEKKSSSSIPL